MPIDLDGLALIDMLLDTTIELCLLPEIWTEKELAMIRKMHGAVLRLNQLWMEEDVPNRQFIHDVKPFVSIIKGYLDLLELTLNADKQAILAPYATRLERHLKLIMKKIDFFVEQIRASLD
jgi:hypothetical protein